MDPTAGRFITVDPVKDFYNPYSYVRNNPMNLTDPTGMSAGGGDPYYYGGLGRIKRFFASHREVNRSSDPFGWISRFSSAFKSFKANQMDTESWSKEIAYKEEYNRVRNLLEELKGKVEKIVESTLDPLWYSINNEIESLLEGNNLYSMLEFASMLSSKKNYSGTTPGQYNIETNMLSLSLESLNATFSDEWHMNTIIHELVHKIHDYPDKVGFKKSESIYSEIFSQEYSMRFWHSEFPVAENIIGPWPHDEINRHGMHYDWYNKTIMGGEPFDGYWLKVLNLK